MTKKIVAIGGGENGRVKSDGTKLPYETGSIDLEIIKLTEKENPNFLFIGHAQTKSEYEESYFQTMKNIYEKMYNCSSRIITKQDLITNKNLVSEYIEWADIVYIGGGDTKSMIELWLQTGFDKLLKKAWEDGKVMCGVSAGANCWFKSCSSDSLKMQLNNETAPFIIVDCLNFINAFFVPHCNNINGNSNRLIHMKESLKDTDLLGIAMSNCCAIEIVDNKYRLITSDASKYGIEAYGLKTYWKDGKYIEEKIEKLEEFKDINKLLSKINKEE